MPCIVVSIDLSISSDRVIRRAVVLAKATGARLLLTHVETDPEPGPAYTSRREELDDMAREIADQDRVYCESWLGTGNVADQLQLASEKYSAQLIVVGPHERGLKDLVIGSTVEALTQRARVPVLVANALPHGTYRHILIATRLDEASAKLARWLVGNPLGGSPKLSMLFIHDPIGGSLRASSSNSAPNGSDYAVEELRLASRKLDDLVEQNGLTGAVCPQVRLQRAPVSLELDEYASEMGCDLVAIAASQKPFLERVVIGSAAKDVLRELEKDILIFPQTRPPARET